MGFAGLAVGAAMVCINHWKPETIYITISYFDSISSLRIQVQWNLCSKL